VRSPVPPLRGEVLTRPCSAKQTAIEQGGKIVHESKLIKSITSELKSKWRTELTSL
jgi:hypothetical protein